MSDELRKAVMPITTLVKDSLKDRDDRARALKKGGHRIDGIAEEKQHRDKEAAAANDLIASNAELAGIANPSGLYELTGIERDMRCAESQAW